MAKLGDYEFRCSNRDCRKVHKRSLWSIAHINESQRFICECGTVTDLPAGKVNKRRKP
jgi:hypothetical protein